MGTSDRIPIFHEIAIGQRKKLLEYRTNTAILLDVLTSFFTKLPKKNNELLAFILCCCFAVCVPAVVSTVVGVSTVAGIHEVAGLSSPVDACDVSIVSAAVLLTVNQRSIVARSCFCCWCPC